MKTMGRRNRGRLDARIVLTLVVLVWLPALVPALVFAAGPAFTFHLGNNNIPVANTSLVKLVVQNTSTTTDALGCAVISVPSGVAVSATSAHRANRWRRSGERAKRPIAH